MTFEHDVVAETLRRWALDESLKAVVLSDRRLASLANAVSSRYSAGRDVSAALDAARLSGARGHAVSLEYVGESVRDRTMADAETDVFVELVRRMADTHTAGTVSLDLSHIGALVDRGTALRNAGRILEALQPSGNALMISAESSERTDLVLALHRELSLRFDNVGITLQARLHRTAADLRRVLDLPGPVRLVKGAFLEAEDVALSRESDQLASRYLGFAQELIDSGTPTSLATHDHGIIGALLEANPTLRESDTVEFEMLRGIDPAHLDQLHAEGFRTREYSIFGHDTWLYVLNRIAENPERVFSAIVDLSRMDTEIGRGSR
jgi:proline dehydrogenase